MQEHEKSFYTLITIGLLVALGKLLTSDDVITPRLFFGRLILGGLVSVVAGAALFQIPNASPLAINGLGTVLAIAGYQVVEIYLRRRALGKKRVVTMTLSEKQQLFTVMVASLIHWAEEHGYRLTFGEAYRTPEQAALNAKKGSGITNSLHTQRLAVDFNLFVNGQYKTDTADYLPLGEYWESLGGTWGGRFKSRPDGNHFSLEHNGVR